MKKYFYLTTTLPYVNAKPHIGHAAEFVRADVLARLKLQEGYDVYFNTGADEHGQKIYESAIKKNITPQDYVDQNTENLKIMLKKLNILDTVHFVRTTDSKHIATAQAFWKRVADNGYIYKKKYESKYCVGCELEKTDSELVNNKCQDHPNKEIQIINEENYFFKFSAFQTQLLNLYKSRPDFVVPDIRQKEIVNFVKSGLKDFSISRLQSKLPWGVPVPGDSEHTMYVWFDALTSYISTLGWPQDEKIFNMYWENGTPTQYCGQDNLRQQSAMWQAMLMAVGLPNSYQIIVNGFVTGEGGIKMSKTIGNIIDPILLQKHYGTDAVRYYLLRHIHPWDGSPITHDSFYEAYNGHLVNGLGNLTSRLMTLSEKYIDPIRTEDTGVDNKFVNLTNMFRYDLACNYIWELVSQIDKEISSTEPFKLVKTEPRKAKDLIRGYVLRLYTIGKLLLPIMPETANNIISAVRNNKNPEILFERKEKFFV